jgi:hypothetical protein
MARTLAGDSYKREVGRRFSQYLDCAGLSVSEAAEVLDVSIDLVYKAKRGDCLIANERLAWLADAKTIKTQPCNLHWLLTGRGAMFSEESETPKPPPPLDRLNHESLQALNKLLEALANATDKSS